jgi:hypothetical protein
MHANEQKHTQYMTAMAGAKITYAETAPVSTCESATGALL